MFCNGRDLRNCCDVIVLKTVYVYMIVMMDLENVMTTFCESINWGVAKLCLKRYFIDFIYFYGQLYYVIVYVNKQKPLQILQVNNCKVFWISWIKN